MRFLSLFAGIGGFDLGLERAGMECAGQVEIDPYCTAVLAHHWPHVKRVGDIREVRGDEFGAVDLVCGGFPCQPFSCAWKRKGKADDRYLWPEMLRVIKAYRPAWVLGENVAGIIGVELDKVLADLEALGYSVQCFVIPACAVDAPHRRDRVWIVAHARCSDGKARSANGVGNEEPRAELQVALPSSDVAHANRPSQSTRLCEGEQGRIGWGRSGGGSGATSAHDNGERLEGQVATRIDTGESGLSGKCCRWFPEPDVGGTLDGLSSWLDGFDMTISHKLYLSYAKTKNQRPGEVLRALRDSILSQGVQWPAGRSFCFSSSQILLSYLCKLETQATDKAWLQSSGEEALESVLRSMPSPEQPASTPYRPRHKKQQAGKCPDSLYALSSLLARHSEKAWVAYRRSDAYTGGSWENGIARLAHGIPNRVAQLRALGNAVVPQVVEQIGRAIVMAERRLQQTALELTPAQEGA